jgi:hypothetical protein
LPRLSRRATFWTLNVMQLTTTQTLKALDCVGEQRVEIGVNARLFPAAGVQDAAAAAGLTLSARGTLIIEPGPLAHAQLRRFCVELSTAAYNIA